MNQETTIALKKETRDQLKIIAIFSNKKLYELIEESVPLLKEKYHVRNL